MNEKRTGDIGLAAYLSLHYPLKRIHADGERRSLFVFDATPEMEAESLQFLSRLTTVEPITFLEQVRALKGGLR